MRKKRYQAKATNTPAQAQPKDDATVIEFGGIEKVTPESPIRTESVEFDEAERFYNTPVNFGMLSGMLTANSYHGAIVEARTRMLSKDFVDNPALSFVDMMGLGKDLITFGNGYLQVLKNAFGMPIALRHVAALNTRKGKKNRFVRLNDDDSRTWYKSDEIFHFKLYDPRQNIYGLCDYLSGIESALLSQDATRFRRRYYKNGMHMGFILYMTDPNMTTEAETELVETLKKSRGVGNFSSMLINIPNGGEKGVQLIPVGNVGSKDEFEGIKKVSSQEVIVAHRFPAGISGILPPEGASLGDPLKYSEAYFENEIKPLHKLLMTINAILPSVMHLKFDWPKAQTKSAG